MRAIRQDWFAALSPRSLRARVLTLLALTLVAVLLISGAVGLMGGLRYREHRIEEEFRATRLVLLEALAAREKNYQQAVAVLAQDGYLATQLDALAVPSVAPALRRQLLEDFRERLALIGSGSGAAVLAYDRDGQALGYATGEDGQETLAHLYPEDAARAVHAGFSPDKRMAGWLPERQAVRLSSLDKSRSWRFMDGELALVVSQPVLAGDKRRVGFVAILARGWMDQLTALVRRPAVSLSWILPDGRMLGASKARPPAEAIAGAPALLGAPAGKPAADAGRFENAFFAGQVLRLPAEGGVSPLLAITVDKAELNGHLLSATGIAMAAFLLAALFSVPLVMRAGQRLILDPVARLVDGARLLEAEGAVRLQGAEPSGELERVERVLDGLAVDWQHRARETDLWTAVFEKTREAIFVTDTAGTVLFANPALSDVTGRRVDEVVGHLPNFLRANLHDEDFYNSVWQALRSRGHWSGEVWDQKSDGTAYPQWLSMTAITDRDGDTTHYVGIFTDISERKAQEARIHFLAHHDALTGLPNRTLLMERLSVALGHADREQHALGLLFIDLDRFKFINDTLGHTTGDGLLQAVAERLRRAVRGVDTVCRLGGDEFIVLLSRMRDEKDAEQVAEHILAVLAPATRIEGHDLSITPSIGISIYPKDASSADELIRNADAAMYYAKAQGRNNFQRFKPAMTEMAAEHLSLEHSLRLAVDRDEFVLHYQPQIDIATRRLVAVEALVRWTSKDFGPVSPAKFIPIAEESGLILQIGDWVLREACRQRAEWNLRGVQPFPVAVNVSALQFRQPDFSRRVKEALQLFGVGSQELELELTESIVMHEADMTSRTLVALKELGVAMSVDDFGTGYSSLGYLKRLPIEKLKIDKSFVCDIDHDEADRAIVEAIVSMGRALGLKLVAEGVENRSTLTTLSRLGCHMAQGYYYCKPMAAEEFEAWLAASPLIDARRACAAS